MRKTLVTGAAGGSIIRALRQSEFEAKSCLAFMSEAQRRTLGTDGVWLPPSKLFEPGNQELPGLVFLVDLARFLRCSRVFEIGTYNGLTALTLAENLPEPIIDTLDLPSGTRPILEVSDADEPHLRDRPSRAYEGTHVESRVKQHYGDSAAFDFAPFHNKIDLIYVDGAHSPPYVEHDTATAFKLASSRSAIVWDDYWWIVRSVAAVLDRQTDRTLLRVPGTRLAVWMSSEASTLLAEQKSELPQSR